MLPTRQMGEFRYVFNLTVGGWIKSPKNTKTYFPAFYPFPFVALENNFVKSD